MNIQDYFIAKTKPIQYPRNHFKSVTVDGEDIILQPFMLEDSYLHDASDKERHEAIVREWCDYGNKTLTDNTMLCTALTAIEKTLQGESLYYTTPIMQELYTVVKGKLHVDDHINKLTQLYLLYLCYKEIVWEQHCLTADQIAYMRKTLFKEEALPRSVLCWEFIAYILTMFHSGTVTTELRLDPPTLYEVQVAPSLYHALLYQLILHIASGKEGLDGYHIAECQSCHQPFKKKHGNTKFCELCGRNSERVRDYKRREKEKQHAQENNP